MLDHSVLQLVAEQMMGAFEDANAPAKNAVGVGQPRPKNLGQAESDNSQVSQKRRDLGHPSEILVEGKSFPVMRTGVNRFRTVRFETGGKGYQAIEQNPEKPSRWGQLAREGHKVVQFREIGSGKYVAVSVDGKVTEYGRES